MREELKFKDCPFCGGVAIAMRDDMVGSFWGLCLHCGSEGPCSGTEAEATAAWNRRAPQPAAPRVTP